MPYTIEKNKNEAIFTLTITKDDVKKGMIEAAKSLSNESSIPGFRPGKASYEVVKQRVGEMKILETASENLIRSEFFKAMLEENLETVGQPYFEMIKMAPGNEMVVKATVAMYPKIKKLADYSILSIEKKETKPSKKMIEQAMEDLTRMQTKEIRRKKGEKLEQGDKVVLNLIMKKDGVVLEGGEGLNHAIYTNEKYYIDGMIDELIGSKEGDELNFKLSFPKDHYQKHLADKKIDFEIKINEIYELQKPEINDDFAKKLGIENLDILNEKIEENLKKENEVEENVRQEQECLDILVKKSDFDEIPEILVNQEINKMLGELEHTLTQRNMKMDDYLTSIKKSIAELKLDFTPTSIKRIKAALILRELAKKENIKIDQKDIDSELDKIAANYEDEATKKSVFEPRFRDYVEQQLLTKKTVDWLKGKMVK